MLYYKITEAEPVYYIELIDTDPDDEWNATGERYYFQCQFLTANDSPIYESARYVIDADERELDATLRNGFGIVNTSKPWLDLDSSAILHQCYEVIDKIKAYPVPLVNPRDN